MKHCAFVFAFVISVQCAKRTVDNSCPKSLLQAEDKKYLQVEGDTCYRFVTYSKKVYKDAENTCKRDGGHFVMPKSPELNDYVNRKLKNKYKRTNLTWIGLHDKKDEGKFKWEDGSALQWENFASDSGPNNKGFLGLPGKAQDCVAIHDDARWHDYQCDDDFLATLTFSKVKKPFVCQYPAQKLSEEVNEGKKKNNKAQNKDKGFKIGNDTTDVNDQGHSGTEEKTGKHSEIDEDSQEENGERQSKDTNSNYKKPVEIESNKNSSIIAPTDAGAFSRRGGSEERGSNDVEAGKDANKELNDQNDNSFKQNDTFCPPFDCDRFCGMSGYRTDVYGCLLCECV